MPTEIIISVVETITNKAEHDRTVRMEINIYSNKLPILKLYDTNKKDFYQKATSDV